MEKLFKVGDKVYCILHGWGEVLYADYDDDFGIHVRFSLTEEESFTHDGRFYLGEPKILSFTEYTLEGFSQERPEELPNKGDIVWVKDYENEEWHIRYFVHKFESEYYVTSRNPFAERQNGSYYKFMTTTNPYKNEKI